MARALFHEPSILLCDEPTGNLDSQTGRDIVELLADLHREAGLVIVAATHDEAVSEVSDRIVQLREGRLITGPESPA